MTGRTLLYWNSIGVLVLIAALAQPLRAASPTELSGEAGEGFGTSVALSDGTLLVGAPHVNCTTIPATPTTPAVTVCKGAAYVFVNEGGGVWSAPQELPGPVDTDPSLGYGYSVALSEDGNTALVGSPGLKTNAGAVYVWVRSGGTWNLQKTLAGPASSWFGCAVALSGNTALVGADGTGTRAALLSGAAYVYTGSGGDWTQTAKVAPKGLGAGDMFGWSVALSGDTAFVGAPNPGVFGGGHTNPGAVYYYINGSWSNEKEKIVPGGLRNGDEFGKAVALSGDTAVFSAPRKPAEVASAYVYVRSGEWKLQEQLRPPAPELPTNDSPVWGAAVAVFDEIALVGAPDGHAFPFFRSGTSWTRQDDLVPEDSTLYDFFGNSVAVFGTTAVVAAPGSSKVYVYTLR